MCRRWDFDSHSQEDPHWDKLHTRFPLERRDLNTENVLEGWYFPVQSQTSVAFSFSRFLESFSSGWCSDSHLPNPWISAGIYGALTHTYKLLQWLAGPLHAYSARPLKYKIFKVHFLTEDCQTLYKKRMEFLSNPGLVHSSFPECSSPASRPIFPALGRGKAAGSGVVAPSPQ